MACGGSAVATLRSLSFQELVSLLQSALSVPLSNRNINRVGSYLILLPGRIRSELVENTLSCRPMWVPIDYHWASLELDPVLLLLSLQPIGESLQRLSYPCHPLNRDLLIQALGTMTTLKALTLEEACDNEILGVVGGTCRALHLLNVSHSKQVNDDGVRRLCLKRNVYMKRKWQNVVGRLKGLSLKWGSGGHHGGSRGGGYHQLQPSRSHDPDDLNPCCTTLTHVYLAGTRVTELGVMYLKAALPNLSVLATE